MILSVWQRFPYPDANGENQDPSSRTWHAPQLLKSHLKTQQHVSAIVSYTYHNHLLHHHQLTTLPP